MRLMGFYVRCASGVTSKLGRCLHDALMAIDSKIGHILEAPRFGVAGVGSTLEADSAELMLALARISLRVSADATPRLAMKTGDPEASPKADSGPARCRQLSWGVSPYPSSRTCCTTGAAGDTMIGGTGSC